MPVIRATKNGIPVIVNTDHIVYAEPNGNGTSTNIYMSNREMLTVSESLDSVETIINDFAELQVFEALPGEIETPQERETPAGSSKNKNKVNTPDESKPANAPETKSE